MRTYKIEFEKAALKFLNKQDKKQRLRLYSAIYKLPDNGDINDLTGTNKYRLRVGKYRVLYTVDKTIRVVNIENIDSRGQIYKRL